MAPWETVAAQKRESVQALIPSEWRISNAPSRQEQRDVTGTFAHQYLTPAEVEITELDAVEIVEKTTTGSLSAVTVTKAFCHRAALAHQLTNCLLEIFFDDALKQAEKLDEYFATNKKPIGPLHGLPVSLKDQFHVKGVETSMGYVGWIGTFQGQKGTGKEKVHESELTKELRALGAVFYCKTSVPHTLMSGETNNHIMGYCWNPKNRLLSAGGSSGGEGALIAFRGSPLGFGSDIGGSVRIPAAFCGLYGLRPSAGRVPYEGAANSMDGQNSVLSVLGPLSTSVASLRLAMKAVLSQQPWLHDPLCLEIPWRADEEQRTIELINKAQKFSFGYAKSNGVVRPHPPVQRALERVAQTLEDLGHEIFDWEPTPSHAELTNIAATSWMFDGGRDVHHAFGLSGEPPLPQVVDSYGLEPKAEKGATHIAETNVTKREAQKAYMEYWNSTKDLTVTGRPVDCIISPVAATAATDPEHFSHYMYTMWVNTLDYTSVVIPVTFADKNVDAKPTSYKALNNEDEKVASFYDPDVYHGAPVGIQLVGRRLQEEKMLVLADYVAKALAAR